MDQIDQPDQGRTDRAPRRVAVISVHGAAHHDPGETANAIADLLLSLPSFNPKQADKPCEEQEPREFEHFDSKDIQIPLKPVCTGQRVDVERNQITQGPFRLQEGSYKFALHLWKEKHVGKERGQVGRQWSIKLLQDYYGAANSNKYVTTRLEGQRTSDDTEVHVYEMFWADLARPTNTILSFFLALFQLILHLPSLSRLAIESRPNPNRNWRMFQACHRYASRILQIALPLANANQVLTDLALTAATKIDLTDGNTVLVDVPGVSQSYHFDNKGKRTTDYKFAFDDIKAEEGKTKTDVETLLENKAAALAKDRADALAAQATMFAKVTTDQPVKYSSPDVKNGYAVVTFQNKDPKVHAIKDDSTIKRIEFAGDKPKSAQ